MNPMIRSQHARDLIAELGAEFIAFDNKIFGESYPYGNKTECLTAIPNDNPFLFFDGDTLILDELSMCRLIFRAQLPRCAAQQLGRNLWGQGITTQISGKTVMTFVA